MLHDRPHQIPLILKFNYLQKIIEIEEWFLKNSESKHSTLNTNQKYHTFNK